MEPESVAFSSSMSLSFPPTDFVPVQARTHHQQTRNPAGADGRLWQRAYHQARRRNQESAWLAVEEFQRFRWHCISESLRAHHVIFRVIRTSCKQHISHKNNRPVSAWTLRLGFKADADTTCYIQYVKRVLHIYSCMLNVHESVYHNLGQVVTRAISVTTLTYSKTGVHYYWHYCSKWSVGFIYLFWRNQFYLASTLNLSKATVKISISNKCCSF